MPTRRLADEPATRRTSATPPGSAATPTPTSAPALTPTQASTPPAPAPAPQKKKRPIRRLIVTLLVFMAVGATLNEGCVSSRANAIAATVPLKDFQGLNELWPEYRRLEDRSSFGGVGVARLRSALANQTLVLAERVMANYRTPNPTVREGQWRAAADALRRAIVISPDNRDMRAALQLCEGHLLRINGEADKSRGQHAEAQEQFTGAVVAFREAAAIRPGWPDPFLGLARTFIYGLEDVDRGSDALAQAEKDGHKLSEREITQLGDGYRLRGETLARTAQTLKGLEQERDYLTRASQAFKDALARYERVAGYGNVAAMIRDTQRRRDAVEARLGEITKWWWPWG
jgi:hypothetical protein